MRPACYGGLSSPGTLWASNLPPADGELVRSLTYRQTYTPTHAGSSYGRPARCRLTADAPELLRTAAGGAWALVSMTAAGSVLLLVIVAAVRLPGVLT